MYRRRAQEIAEAMDNPISFLSLYGLDQIATEQDDLRPPATWEAAEILAQWIG